MYVLYVRMYVLHLRTQAHELCRTIAANDQTTFCRYTELIHELLSLHFASTPGENSKA